MNRIFIQHSSKDIIGAFLRKESNTYLWSQALLLITGTSTVPAQRIYSTLAGYKILTALTRLVLEPLIVRFMAQWWNYLNAKSGWPKVMGFHSSISVALPLNRNRSPWLLKSIAPKMLLATVRKMENVTCDEGEELFGLLGVFSYLFPIPQYILLQLQRQHPDFSPMRKKNHNWVENGVCFGFFSLPLSKCSKETRLSPRNASRFWAMWKYLRSQWSALLKKHNL